MVVVVMMMEKKVMRMEGWCKQINGVAKVE